MTKITEFVYWLNRTDPGIPGGVVVGLWDAGKVTARLEVNYETQVRLGITYQEIMNADPEALAMEVAERMRAQYQEKTAMPLLEGKSG